MRILVGGDICPTKYDEEQFVNGNENLFDASVRKVINQADFVIANLETPLIEELHPIQKSGAVFGNTPQILNFIKNVGIDYLNLANNHILDHGEKGLFSTLNSLEQKGIQCGGAGMDFQQANDPKIIEIKGEKLGILAYTEHEFSVSVNNQPGANPLDIIDFSLKIDALRKEVDLLILLYHGGKEHYALPSPQQQKNCRFFIDSGVDAVICQHSHMGGAIEDYKNKKIIYGQGNFQFDPQPLKHEWLYKGILVELILDQKELSFNFLPIVHRSLKNKKAIGVSRMSGQEGKEYLLNLHELGEKVKEINFVENEWEKECLKHEQKYLSVINGNGRVMRKLNEKFKFLNLIYSGKRKTILKNVFWCETHREIVQTLLKRNN